MSQCLAAGQGFENTSRPYFVDVELIQIEKTELYCAMFFQITKMLLNTVSSSATARQFMQCNEALLWLASGQDFQNTPRLFFEFLRSLSPGGECLLELKH